MLSTVPQNQQIGQQKNIILQRPAGMPEQISNSNNIKEPLENIPVINQQIGQQKIIILPRPAGMPELISNNNIKSPLKTSS